MDRLTISKACFAFKGIKTPRKSSARKRRRVTDVPKSYIEDKQYLAYKVAWKNVEEEVQRVQTRVLSDITTSVVDRIEELSLLNNNRFNFDIPTVALMTGINLPDHDMIFSQLLASLELRNFNRIAYIKSCDCNNIKTMIQNVTFKLVNAYSEEDEKETFFEFEDSESEEEIQKTKTLRSNCLKWTLPSLVSTFNKWKKNNEIEVDKEKLIIIIDDIEHFAPHVLEDFVAICSEYKNELPWIFVFGIPTTLSSLHRSLRQTVSKNLSIEKFEAPISSHILDQVVNKVLMSDEHPFKLGVKCYKLLEEIFLFHDLSVNGFKRRLQYCMMEHFYSNFLSTLCCSQTELKAKINDLDVDGVENYRKLPSFMKYVESCNPIDQKKFLLDDEAFREFLLEKLNNFHEYHKIFFPALFCLHQLSCSLPNLPLGRLARELYGKILETPLCESKEYIDAIKLLRLLSKDELLSSIDKCITILNTYNLKEPLKNFKNGLEEINSKLQNIENIKTPVKHKPSPQKYMPTATSRSEFLLNLRISRPKEQITIFEMIRNEIIDYFDTMFKSILISPTTLPFHEVLYFNDIRSVKGQLMPTPRSSIHIALNDPHEYLQCGCCAIEEHDRILATMPDICILYKLHLECGRMINLYDLLQAFSAMIESTQKSKQNSQKTIQARFAKAVSELQFLGYVKATQRKADHLVRLTWGDY